MAETLLGTPETDQHYAAADVIPGISTNGAAIMDTLIKSAVGDPTGTQIWLALEAWERSPSTVDSDVRNRRIIRDQRPVYRAMLWIDRLVNDIAAGVPSDVPMSLRDKLLSSISPHATAALDGFDKSFTGYRARVSTCKQQRKFEDASYQPYMARALIVGLALFAARNTKSVLSEQSAEQPAE